MLYQLECKLTDQDYYEFNKYHLLHAPEVRRSSRFNKLIVPAIFLIYLLAEYIMGADWYTIGFSAILYAIISVVWIFSVKYIHLGIMKLNIYFMKKSGKLPYDTHATMQFFEDCFVEITEKSKTEATYTGVQRVCVQEGRYIYLYKHAVGAYIIPFHAFESTAAAEEFIRFIKEKTNKCA